MKLFHKSALIQLYIFLKSLRSPKELYIAFRAMFGEGYGDHIYHLKLAADWLIQAQKNSKSDPVIERTQHRGYSRGYYLYRGWDKGYIETTGYIIPTMYEVSKILNDKKYQKSAQEALIWLSNHQLDNGSFPDIDKGISQAFDTGQILYGLNYIVENDLENRELAAQMAIRAGVWLSENLDKDGSWEKISFNRISHSYYSRVAAALYKTGVLLGKDEFCDAATRNIKWTIAQQNQYGFFEKLKFTIDEEAFLHTMMYVVEGLIDFYNIQKNKDQKIIESILKMVEPLLHENLKKSYFLGSQYNEKFEIINRERCMTGLAQWAGVCFELYQMTGREDFYKIAKINLYYLKTKQVKCGVNLQGAISGSNPIWGAYSPYAFNNWPVKFFMDALIADTKLSQIHHLKIDEQENFVSHCFSLQPDIIATQLSQTSQKYINLINKLITSNQKIMDLGCGSGMVADNLEKNLNCKIDRVDPVMHLFDSNIKYGSVHYLSQLDEKYDVIYCLEVLQHSDRLDQFLSQVKLITNNKAYVIVGDRSPMSVKYILKFIKETIGLWMYPWDSPFKEKWRSRSNLNQEFKKHGFQMVKATSFTSGKGRIPFMNRYQLLVFVKV